MAPEEMGKVSYRMRLVFAASSLLFVAVLAVSPVKDLLREWKHYKRGYLQFARTRPDTKRLTADYHPDLDQIWIPEMNVVDRCTSCHQGITQPTLADASVPQPYRAHPPIPHRVRDWGCTPCHRGQGVATEVAEAHETTLAWEQPILPGRYLQGACGSCHHDARPELPKLNRGRELLESHNCAGCHRLQDIERREMQGPDLTSVGTKVSRAWIYKWLKEPRTIVDDSGNVKVNGYETEESPRMPQFRLTEQELRDLSAYLSAQRSQPVAPYKFSPAVVAKWAKRPDVVDQGELRFRQMFCSTCHSFAVTRAGETTLIGGNIGPELTKVGSKVNPDWLVAWLRNPQGYLAHSKMPRYEWSDEDLFTVTRYIQAKLSDSDLLSDVPQLSAATTEEIASGKRIFSEKGCASCHAVGGSGTQKDFGPDLSALGSKNVSQLEFGTSKIPRNLISYIQAKITDPRSVNSAARMPQYNFNAADLDAITTALLSMTGPPATSALQKLTIPRANPQFQPAGEFARVYERYRCADCHKFNGYGGDLAPDLSYEGSRAQRQWIISFLKNPQTLRPTLTFRMPQFNMSDREAATLADYLSMVMQSPNVRQEAVSAKDLTPAQAALGKELYEVKYQCQSCHTIGSGGGYVGPNLNNAGNWLKPEWIAAWLSNPQALAPGTIEPRRSMTDGEIKALTAYLMTQRQSGGKAAQKHAAVHGTTPGGNGVAGQ
ncbi:MAG: c-type cytochrome [Acidobacteriia bacterium]|nr:c-type cytochrome [Terriglobia bacterium]